MEKCPGTTGLTHGAGNSLPPLPPSGPIRLTEEIKFPLTAGRLATRNCATQKRTIVDRLCCGTSDSSGFRGEWGVTVRRCGSLLDCNEETDDMRSTLDGPPSPCGQEPSSGRNNTNNNNNNGGDNSDNSGCQYALCALGVGLVALGIVMVVWSVVPANTAQNSSSIVGGGGGKKDRVSSVAFVLVGCGVLMLLLSLGLGMRIKQRRLREARNHAGEAGGVQEEGEMAEERAQRYAVPSYEEAVGSGQYPVLQSNRRPSSSQLPSYDDLLKVDGVVYEHEVPEAANDESRQAPTPAANHRPGKNSRKLLPINIRRIKSEKFHLKNNENSQPAAELSIEPLTPPPQYEDKVPPL